MKRIIKKILKYTFYRLRLIIRLNLIKTVYINFKTQSFSNAIKFPVFVYGRLKILSLKGDIIIKSPIKTGMLKIGYKYIDLFPNSLLPTQFNLSGNLIMRGNLIVGGGVYFGVERRDAILEFGANCTIGGGSVVKSTYQIICGDNVQITGECVVMDCEMHYVKNIETGTIKRYFDKIEIQNNCWINQRAVISKSTIIPEFSIVTRNSYLNKDYTPYGTNLLLSGSPAVPKNQKVQRIFNNNMERELGVFFRQNQDIQFIPEQKGIIDGDYNNSPIFNWLN